MSEIKNPGAAYAASCPEGVKGPFVEQKASAVIPGRSVGLEEQKLGPNVDVRSLYQPGELEGGRRRATDPTWSLNVYRIERTVTKPNEPVLYYLQDAEQPRSFVREELLVVPYDTQLPPDEVLSR